ncbi:hypothetical protein ACFXC8_30290 [Streptomyces sp. NPDC059441]|uniref:hypothetical protein n=1 Tax=Streptomyces sp. NPDC059441 TaxID=3346829 RepID=UPI00367837EB
MSQRFPAKGTPPTARQTYGARKRLALGRERVTCHDQAVVNLSKIVRPADVLLDLMGVAVGAMLLAVGIATYRDGGSLGWPIAGSVLFLINLWVARRRFARRRRPAPSP